jgi:hypothetical protein
VIDARFRLAITPLVWRALCTTFNRIGMRIRLTRKFALCLNGVDISKLEVGDEVDLPEQSAQTLIAHDWAEAIAPLAPPAGRPRPQSVRAD